MKDLFNSNKVFMGVVLATLILLFGGVYLFTRNGDSPSPSNKISNDLLIPAGSVIAGGLVNGQYQKALTDAKVTLVEFGDYQCPACGSYNPLINKLLTDFAGKINFAFRNFAFLGTESTKAAEAVACANDQNKYWEYHEYLYSHQNGENKGTFSDDNLKSLAKDLGLEPQTFNACLDSGKYKAKIENSTNDGKLAGVNSTPTFFINGVKIANPGSYDGFKKLIENALNNQPTASATSAPAYHAHFDLKVYQNDVAVNFTLPKYQESKTNPLDENIHFHDGNGKVVHLHKEGIPTKDLFDSFKLSVPTWSVAFVNGKRVDDILIYVPQDLDQILIGSTNVSSVSNDACIYSLKCPVRGTPPPEDCVGGLGTGCTD